MQLPRPTEEMFPDPKQFLWVNTLWNMVNQLANASFASVTLSNLTASQAVFSDANKKLVSNAITGTGNVVMSASPTLTGTIVLAAATASGLITANGGVQFGGSGASPGKIRYESNQLAMTSGTSGVAIADSTNSFNNFLVLDNGNTTIRGSLQVNNLAGVGSRAVVVDANGLMSAP